MAIPDFQTIMLPLLKIAGDGNDHAISEVIDRLAQVFMLSNEERQELLPSGRQAKFDNRVGWARTHLAKAGLLVKTGHGRFQITDRGRQALNGNPSTVNMKLLEQFPEFVEFRTASQQPKKRGTEPTIEEQTPEEVLEAGYQGLRNQLAQELLTRVKASPPKFFERLVVDLLVAMGYGGSRKDAGEAVGQGGDDGVDGLIKEDKLGLDVVYIQAKRWEGAVGRPVVQAFAGSLEGFKARKGVMITTSRFTSDAYDYISRIEKKIVLIDGDQLGQFMVDYGVGVTDVATYVVKRVDVDYFEEG
ncbi:MAG: restriction endonuclease [Dehalococcoidia bacterium]